MRASGILTLATFAIALFLPSLAVDAELIAYEGFDYPAEAGLEFNNGGIGWDDQGWAWRVNFDGKGSIVFNAAWIEAGSLSYGDLQTTGNHVHLYGDSGQLEMARKMASVIPGTDGTHTYISMIGQRLGPLADTVNKPDGTPWDDPETPEVETYPWGTNLYPRGTSLRFWNDTNSEKLGIGNYSNQETNEWMVFGSGLLHPSGVPFTETAFVVVRIDHVGDELVADNIFMWVNPDLSLGEDTALAQLQLIGVMDVNDPEAPVDMSRLSWISPYAGHASGNRPYAEMLMDEIRVGTTWDAVTPQGVVVEPTRIIGLSGTLDFEDVLVGETTTATMNIANTGNEALTVSDITYPEGFTGDWASGTINAGGSQDVTVTFSPLAVQAYGGDISVESDATSGPSTITASGTGFEETAPTEWAGFSIINAAGDVDTGSFLGWVNIANAPIVLSYSLDTYFYILEDFVSDAGAWGFVYNQSTDAPMGGDAAWAGYTVLSSQDVETRRFLGWINILQAPYVFSYSFSYWIYMPEDFVSAAGAWGYFFDRN